MVTVFENLPAYWSGLLMTLYLSGISGFCALMLGSLLAVARICPIGSFRFFSASYVEIVRNIPLTLVFFFCVVVLPRLGIKFEQFTPAALIALTFYTSTFFCESIRSGINNVSLGQAEAARSIGLTFSQSLVHVVIPQALRASIAPSINVMIALVKNSSVAGGFYVNELFNAGRTLATAHGDTVIWVLLGVALFYLFVTVPLGLAARHIERRFISS